MNVIIMQSKGRILNKITYENDTYNTNHVN